MNGLIREHGNRLDEESLRTFLCEAEYTINQQTSDSGDSKRSPLCTTIIADETCAAPTWRV